MTDIPAEAAKAAAQATAASEVKKPQPLTTGERVAAILLFASGLIVIGLTLFAFSSTDSNFTFKSKERTITKSPSHHRAGTTPAPGSGGKCGANCACKKKKSKKKRKQCQAKQHKKQKQKKPKATPATVRTREVEYSEAVAIFALTIGVALALSGGFYGRLRSLKLGALELGLVDPKAATAASEQAIEKVEEKSFASNDKEAAAKAAAQQVAVADLSKAVAFGVQPTEQVIASIADQAATKVAEAIN
jgi:hypothetical protein